MVSKKTAYNTTLTDDGTSYERAHNPRYLSKIAPRSSPQRLMIGWPPVMMRSHLPNAAANQHRANLKPPAALAFHW